jgi:phospholipase C
MKRVGLLLLGLLMVVPAGCAQEMGARNSPGGVAPALAPGFRSSRFAPPAGGTLLGNGKIKHVVIIVQENRTPDDLFNGLPGADTVKYGIDSKGDRVNLQPILLTAPYDLDHQHIAFETEYDDGRLDAFNLEKSTKCQHRHDCPLPEDRAFGYVPRSEVRPYFDIAEQYAFADRMFESDAGPSFPAHQYILSGTSTIEEGSPWRASEEPLTPRQKFTGGCDSPKGSLGQLIDMSGNEDREIFPCFDRPALTDLLEAKSLTWHYYQADVGPGPWNAPDAIRHIRHSPEYSKDVVEPPSTVLTDVAEGRLSNVAWVTPTAAESDHAGTNDGTGPSWVASVVNAIGESRYWNDTVIFILWDDWGGWYDHVKPPQLNSFELGFRVPLIAVSPYAKRAYISHKQHEFGSILKFVEETFDLGSLGSTDVRSDDLKDCFDFSQKPRVFKPIPAPEGSVYFLKQPISTADPDTDF